MRLETREAKHGAKQVHAVEMNVDISKLSGDIIALNVDARKIPAGFIQTRPQNIVSFPIPALVNQVDIIVSEWMGDCLFYGDMWPGVI